MRTLSWAGGGVTDEMTSYVVHGRRGFSGRSLPAFARHHYLLLAMHRSHAVSGAIALVATFFALFAVTAAPARAVESLPDARILSAAPFDFQADREIFSRMPVEPGDSRIFRPRETMRSASASQTLEARIKRQALL